MLDISSVVEVAVAECNLVHPSVAREAHSASEIDLFADSGTEVELEPETEVAALKAQMLSLAQAQVQLPALLHRHLEHTKT